MVSTDPARGSSTQAPSVNLLGSRDTAGLNLDYSHEQVESRHSLRKPFAQAGKMRLRLIEGGTRRGDPQPHAPVAGLRRIFLRSERPAPKVFDANGPIRLCCV